LNYLFCLNSSKKCEKFRQFLEENNDPVTKYNEKI
jgi:hypothetical protein